MRFFKLLICFFLAFSLSAQSFKAILNGKTKSTNGFALSGASIYLIQNQITLGTCASDESGEFLISLMVSKNDPLVLQCSKPGYVSKKLLFTLKDLELPSKITNNIVRLMDSLTIDLMPVNPLVAFSIGDKDYAEKLKWNEKSGKCLTDLSYKKQYNDSLYKRIKDEEGRMLIANFKTISSDFERVKNYTLAIQYLDSAAKKATAYQILDTTIDRKKIKLQEARIAWEAEIAKKEKIDSLFQLGDSLLTILKWEEAKKHYNEILKIDPSSKKATEKLNSIASLKKEEEDRASEIKRYYQNRAKCNEKVKIGNYKEALANLQLNNSLNRIPQTLKDAIKVTADSINILMGAQRLIDDVKASLNEVKNKINKNGCLPGFEAAIQKTQGLISNITDGKKKQEMMVALDELIKKGLDSDIPNVYKLHSNGKTEYDKAIESYEKIKLYIPFIYDNSLRSDKLTDVNNRITDVKNKKLSDESALTNAFRMVKDNLDSITLNPVDNIGAKARISKVKSLLNSEPLKSKAKQNDVLALKSRFDKISAYIDESKNEFPKVSGKDSVAALNAANLLLVKAGTNELGNIEITYLKDLISDLNVKVNPGKNQTLVSTVRGTVVNAPIGYVPVSDTKQALDEMAFTMESNELKVITAWDDVKEGVDKQNQVTGAKEDQRSLAQQQNFDNANDERDVLRAKEDENNKERTDAQVEATDRVNYEIIARNDENLKAVNQRADASVGIHDTIDVRNQRETDQNNAAREHIESYNDQANDTRSIIQQELYDQNISNTDAQRNSVSEYENAKFQSDNDALEQTKTAQRLQEGNADYVDTRANQANYLKDEAGNCFTWNKMTELVYKTANDQGFTTSILTRRIVVNSIGYGIIYEKLTNDKGVNSFSLNGQAISEAYWLQHSSGESVFTEGGPIAPNCK